ncbi:carbohydrate ABC transporter permease [Paenibacillus planticolens]|uniref:ABC transporter permease subunit n=1 Tax=Paenibacillus planticolens TaxID=2654976 RepID=A0ABX1ZG95_9BACL|nr:carbohydrate ABC transporter permease [Paenibacillus planticolens]NOU98692.1 ABC transporter permease subunit [Paenibacillus planticolens]
MKSSKTFRVIQYVFGVLVAFCTLAPFVWLLISSISFQKDLTAVPLKWVTKDITFQRYIDIFANEGNNMAYAFRISMYNSLIVALCTMIIALLIGGLAAHAFARYTFKFKQKMLYMFLFTYMIPSVVIVIPLFTMLQKSGMIDSRWSLIFLDLTFIIPYVIWIMQSYFKFLSADYYEAAYMDGCSRFQTLRLIILPIVRPGVMATGIFAFLLAWDEFFFSLLFTSSLNSKTVPVAIAEFSGKNAVDFGMVATGGVLACLPPLIITIAFQKYLVTGMTSGGVKE